MSKKEAVDALIRSTRHRAIRESSVALALIVFFGQGLRSKESGSAEFYGTLLLILSLGVITGVVWANVIGPSSRHLHPESHHGFWRETFQAQAQLLRGVPFWYLAPLMTGLLLCILPGPQDSLGVFLGMFAFILLISGTLAWSNRKAAEKLDKESLLFE